MDLIGSEILSHWSSYLIGLEMSHSGSWCSSCNPTQQSFLVAVLNTGNSTTARIQVPKDTTSVEVFANKKFEKVQNALMVCPGGDKCEVEVMMSGGPHGIGYLQVKKSGGTIKENKPVDDLKVMANEKVSI